MLVQAVYLAIVNTDIRSFSLPAHLFLPTLGLPRKLIFMGPHFWRNLKENDFFLNIFYGSWFSGIFTAIVLLQPPEPTLVPGVFT